MQNWQSVKSARGVSTTWSIENDSMAWNVLASGRHRAAKAGGPCSRYVAKEGKEMNERKFLLIGFRGESRPYIGREFRTVPDAAGYAWRYEGSVAVQSWHLMTRFKGSWRLAGVAQRRNFQRLYSIRGEK